YQCSVLSPALPQIDGHLLKPIVLMTGTRSPTLPDLPTAVEQGLDVDVTTWHAAVLPKGTPSPIVQKLNEAIMHAVAAPAAQERFKELGIDLPAPERRTPEYLRKYIEGEIAKWAAPIKDAGLIVE